MGQMWVPHAVENDPSCETVPSASLQKAIRKMRSPAVREPWKGAPPTRW